MFEQCKIALAQGFHIATHAIGDAANRMVLKVYAELFDKGFADKNNILRIEHAQHIFPEDLLFFEKYPLIASIQPIHCVSDASTISEKRLGNRCSYAYPWKSLLNHNAIVISGSDFPIENCNPFEGLKAYIYRIPFGKDKPWYPDECINLNEALDSYINVPNRLYKFYDKNLLNPSMGLIIIDKPLNLLTYDSFIQVKAVIYDNKFYQFFS